VKCEAVHGAAEAMKNIWNEPRIRIYGFKYGETWANTLGPWVLLRYEKSMVFRKKFI